MAAAALASSALALGSFSSSSKPYRVANSARSSGWRGGAAPSQNTARLPVLRQSSFLPAKQVVSRFGAEFNPMLFATPLNKSRNAGRNVSKVVDLEMVAMAVAMSTSLVTMEPELRRSRGAVTLAGRSCVRGVSSSVVARVSATTGVNGSASDAAERESSRVGSVSRETKETSVEVSINLDGTGICDCDTGIPFLDHMLDQLASHGLFDVRVKAKGDTYIDDHHTNEDIGLAMGTALLNALGDRKGIRRFGDFSAPLDEALIHVVLDLSGRPYLGYDVVIPTDRVGNYDTQLVEHFFQSMVNTSGMTLHIRQLAGQNSHHIIEATFKAFARALRQATEYDVRRLGSIPSSKGVLSRA